MNADWRDEMLDEVMGFILDTVHDGRVPDLEAIEDGFPQVKEDPQLRAEVESILEMHQWFDDSIGDWQDSVAETEGPPGETVKRPARPIGNRWGDFVLVEELGRGGMGQVFKAWQISKRQFVALKRLDSRLLGDEQARTRFQREPQHMMGIKHQGIVRVFEVGEHASHPYFTMELVDGVSLGVLARNQALPPDQIARIMRQVSRSVSVAHKGKILHRDLKPDNILLTRELEAKVGDFGLAKDLGHDTGLTRSLDVLGTCNYMAPEQAAGKSDQIGVRTDVYGLGAVLYELLTARPPFRGEKTGEVLLQVQDVEPVAPRTINPLADEKLEAICLKCLEKKPDARYASATELADEFERVLHGERPLAPFNSAARRMWRFCRRRPALASLVVVSALAAIGFSVAGVALQQQRVVAREKTLQADEEALRADRAQLLAKEEAMRVEQERVRRRLAEASMSASDGRRYMLSGRWKEALRSLDRAIVSDHPLDTALRLDKAKCLMALGHVEQATEELRTLYEDPGLPAELKASVGLWMGDALVGVDNEKAVSLIEGALSEGLTNLADREYALALLAEDTETAARHLKVCLRLGTHSQRTSLMLPLCLALLGRLDEAGQSLDVGIALFPDERKLWSLRVFLLFVQGEHEDVSQLLAECEAKLGPEEFAATREAGEALRDTLSSARGGNRSSRSARPRAASDLAALLDNSGTFDWNLLRAHLPTAPSFQRWVREALVVVRARDTSNWNVDRKIQLIERLARFNPEGLVYFMLGKTYAVKRHYHEAEVTLEQAIEMPALVDIRSDALYWLALCRWKISEELAGEQRMDYRDRVIDDIYMLSRRWVKFEPSQYRNLVNMARGQREFELAETVVRQWLLHYPDSVQCAMAAGMVQMELENFVSALEWFGKHQVMYAYPTVIDEYVATARIGLMKQALAPEILFPVAQTWLSDRLPKILAAVEKWQSGATPEKATR